MLCQWCMLKQNMVQYTNASVYCFPSRERARAMDDTVKTLCDDRLMSVVAATYPLLQEILCSLRPVATKNEWDEMKRLPCHADVIRLLPTSVTASICHLKNVWLFVQELIFISHTNPWTNTSLNPVSLLTSTFKHAKVHTIVSTKFIDNTSLKVHYEQCLFK